jgi:signal transduction histidine kinase
VRRHGGSISVRPGPGAEFRVSLPLRVSVRALT